MLGVLEAMTDNYTHKETIRVMREEPANPLTGFDLSSPRLIRLMANKLIAHYQMEAPLESERIEPDINISGYIWKDLPRSTQQRVKSLIEHKLSLDYDPTMVDPEWRD